MFFQDSCSGTELNPLARTAASNLCFGVLYPAPAAPAINM